MKLYCIHMDTQNNTPQPSNERKRQKRLADNSLVVCDDESDTSFPSFLVIEPCDNHQLSCQFLVSRNC
jgi:hypothetical protein